MLTFLVVLVVAVSIVKGDNNIDYGDGVDGRCGDSDSVDKKLVMMIWALVLAMVMIIVPTRVLAMLVIVVVSRARSALYRLKWTTWLRSPVFGMGTRAKAVGGRQHPLGIQQSSATMDRIQNLFWKRSSVQRLVRAGEALHVHSIRAWNVFFLGGGAGRGRGRGREEWIGSRSSLFTIPILLPQMSQKGERDNLANKTN